MIDKKQAQETSFAKWHILKSDFNKLFFTVNTACGICKYCLERRDSETPDKCNICKKEFPEVAKVCDKMLNFFSDTNGYVETMINEIIDAIRLQKVNE